MDTVACPHCSGEILDDPALAGQKVDCPHCGKKVKMLEAPAARPAAARPAPPRPAAPRGSSIGSGAVPLAAPPSQPPPHAAMHAAPPDAGPGLLIDPNARPAGSKMGLPKRPPEGNPWLIPSLIGVGVVVIIGLLIALRNRSISYAPNGPAAMVVKINRLGCDGDWGGVFDRLSRATQQGMEERIATVRGEKLSPAQLRTEARNEFIQLGRQNSTAGMQFSFDPIIVSENQNGNRAAVTIRGSGGTMTLNLVYENGAWRLQL
jgi:hypothetical protein